MTLIMIQCLRVFFLVSLIDCHPIQGGNPLRLIMILTTAFGGLYNEKEKRSIASNAK